MALQSMTALASITLQEATSSVSFSGIPQNYRDLIVGISGTNNGSGPKEYLLTLNGDSGNRSRVFAAGYSGGAISGTASTITVGYNTGGIFSTNIFSVFDYSQSDKHKTVLVRNGDTEFVMMQAGRWASTSPVTSMEITCSGANYSSGTTFNLYGRIG